MKEFMLFIKATGNPVINLPADVQQKHIEKVGGYIQKMVADAKLLKAQPLKEEGAVVSMKNGQIESTNINKSEELTQGYYHIIAKDLKEAIEIAKKDPRFEDGNWKIEVRPILKIDGIN